MAQQPPPTITPVPTPPIQRGDRATFSSRVDAFILWLVVAVAQFQAVASNVYANALDAYASAQAALGYRDAAVAARDAAIAARDTAQGYRDTALQARNDAQAARDAAAASATAAANSALALIANSTTTNTVGTGTKTFTIEAGKQIAANEPMVAVSKSDGSKIMFGRVTYSGTTLTMTVTDISGAGSANDWTIAPSGARGPQGLAGTTPGTLYMRIFTTMASWTVEAPSFQVEAIQGGNGGSGYYRASSLRGARGGNTGIKTYQGATVGAVASILVGSGGVAGTAGSSFSDLGTVPGSGGVSSFTLSGFTTLSVGPAVTGADLVIPGGFGTYPFSVSGDAYANGGYGGDSYKGFGGRSGFAGGVGEIGTGYGASGGNGGASSGSGNAGGDGTGGVVIITFVK